MPNKDISRRQQRYLFSVGSPLSQAKKDKLADEIRSGDVHIRSRVRKGHGLSGGRRRKRAQRRK